MGCSSSKPDDATVESSMNDVGAVRREEIYRLVAELRSLGVPSGPPSVPMLEDPSIHSVSLAAASGSPKLKEAISKNPVLLSVINDNLGIAIIAPLRSLSGVRGLLDKAGVILAAVCAAAASLDNENAKGNDTKKKKKNWTKMYSEAVGKLKESRAAGDPFAELDLDELRSACERQQYSLRSALRRRKHELEKTLGSTKKWRRAWNVIYTVGILVVLASLVVLAAVTSLPAAITAAMASATAMKFVEKWIN